MVKSGEQNALQLLFHAAQAIQEIEKIRDTEIRTLLLTNMASELRNGLVAKIGKKKRS